MSPVQVKGWSWTVVALAGVAGAVVVTVPAGLVLLYRKLMGDERHSLAVAVGGLGSFTVATPSAFVALTAVVMVCGAVIVIAVEHIRSKK